MGPSDDPRRGIPPGHPLWHGGKELWQSTEARHCGKELISMSTVPPPQVWPTLEAEDAHALIRFFVDVFGFREVVVLGSEDRVDHAELAWPEGGGVMLGSLKENGLTSRSGSFGGYVVTDDPDAVYSRVQAAEAEIVEEIRSTDYDPRTFTARDPEGNAWTFGTYRGAKVPPEPMEPPD
jgi:uncharacterized glyoxalase superfamily protein PhnB